MLTEIRRREHLIAFLPGMRKETKSEIAGSESAAGKSFKRKSSMPIVAKGGWEGWMKIEY